MFVGVYVVNQVLVHAEWWVERFICLPDSIIDSDFAGLNDRSHLTAQACVMARPAFSSSAALMGLSTIIKRLVSSAKRLMQKCISSTISLMYMRKKERA